MLHFGDSSLLSLLLLLCILWTPRARPWLKPSTPYFTACHLTLLHGDSCRPLELNSQLPSIFPLNACGNFWALWLHPRTKGDCKGKLRKGIVLHAPCLKTLLRYFCSALQPSHIGYSLPKVQNGGWTQAPSSICFDDVLSSCSLQIFLFFSRRRTSTSPPFPSSTCHMDLVILAINTYS